MLGRSLTGGKALPSQTGACALFFLFQLRASSGGGSPRFPHRRVKRSGPAAQETLVPVEGCTHTSGGQGGRSDPDPRNVTQGRRRRRERDAHRQFHQRRRHRASQDTNTKSGRVLQRSSGRFKFLFPYLTLSESPPLGKFQP
ncbi:unnamed protein product [Pleuronectes platessa]|uniref:Uncharacterized protein n=1 Tax=Pleuronectes platessa TaxID=8262 RepID=A0A9N7YYZ7_PLEPL|nr:unnamed protein product [Pleuronectes platessa]